MEQVWLATLRVAASNSLGLSKPPAAGLDVVQVSLVSSPSRRVAIACVDRSGSWQAARSSYRASSVFSMPFASCTSCSLLARSLGQPVVHVSSADTSCSCSSLPANRRFAPLLAVCSAPRLLSNPPRKKLQPSLPPSPFSRSERPGSCPTGSIACSCSPSLSSMPRRRRRRPSSRLVLSLPPSLPPSVSYGPTRPSVRTMLF